MTTINILHRILNAHTGRRCITGTLSPCFSVPKHKNICKSLADLEIYQIVATQAAPVAASTAVTKNDKLRNAVFPESVLNNEG